MKKLIILLILLIWGNLTYGYNYSNQMLLDDIDSENGYRIGFSSGYVRGIANMTKGICIPEKDKKYIYPLVVEHIHTYREDASESVKMTTQIVLLTEWECK